MTFGGDFVPLPRWKGGHWMTLYAWGKPRSFPRLPPAQPRYFSVAPGTRVLAHCHWQAEPQKHPTLIALHGLESSSDAHYVRGLADKAFAAGFNAVRLNQRNCGGTERLSDSLYHSGLTSDPLAVMRELIEIDRLPAFAMAGYSLGGNLTLKLAGDFGDQPTPQLRAVCAVSPTMDLAVCVDALEEKRNAIYQWHFVRNLKRRMRRKAKACPGRWPLEPLAAIRSIREFDDAYTAPLHGFQDAADYYHRASAMRVIDKIGIPTLIITAADDPFVPPGPFKERAVARNRHITLRITEHGGHCGFVEEARDGYDGYWAELQIIEFLKRYCVM
jgi:predicted alpha/beta-fold hydrolase